MFSTKLRHAHNKDIPIKDAVAFRFIIKSLYWLMNLCTNLKDFKVPIVTETPIRTMSLRYAFILFHLMMKHSILLILTLTVFISNFMNI